MRLIRFLSQFAFICNLCFVFAFAIQRIPDPPGSGLIPTIVILGDVVSLIVNLIVNACYAGLLLRRIPFRNILPVWLIIANFLFLILQLIFILT
jgi:hypothetical protein